ncbi:MAG: response regulator [Anaeromyxobacter sp.]
MAEPVRVLVVEDEELLREMIADAIEQAGMAPVCAASGEAAVRIAQQEELGVAVVDHRLSGITGAEFIRWVKESPAPHLQQLPLIGVSGHLGTEQEMLACGACCFIQKPLEVPTLLKAIRWALEVYRTSGAERC